MSSVYDYSLGDTKPRRRKLPPKTEEGNGEGVSHAKLLYSNTNIDIGSGASLDVSQDVEKETTVGLTEKNASDVETTACRNINGLPLDLQMENYPADLSNGCVSSGEDCSRCSTPVLDQEGYLSSGSSASSSDKKKYTVKRGEHEYTEDIQQNEETGKLTYGFLNFGIQRPIQRAFSFEASPARTRSFKLVDPKTARRIRDEILYDNYACDERSYEWSVRSQNPYRHCQNAPTSSTARRSKSLSSRREYLTFGQRRVKLEQVLMILCALAIIIGYSICLYKQLY